MFHHETCADGLVFAEYVQGGWSSNEHILAFFLKSCESIVSLTEQKVGLRIII